MMEEREAILKESEKKLLVLKLLANFFNHPQLYAVYVKTRVIDEIFENDSNLDINKLDLFHIQYTQSLIDLFVKLKKKKERQFNILENEYRINQDIILKIQTNQFDQEREEDMKLYARRVSGRLYKLYQMMAFKENVTFSWDNIEDFALKYHAEYYRKINESEWNQLTVLPERMYSGDYANVESRLFSHMYKHGFDSIYVCGLVWESKLLDIFKIENSEVEYIFIHESKSFYIAEERNITGIDLSPNISNKNLVLKQLIDSNSRIGQELTTVKTSIPNEVEDLLDSYLTKISDVKFLDDLQTIDEQTNILKAMLNMDI